MGKDTLRMGIGGNMRNKEYYSLPVIADGGMKEITESAFVSIYEEWLLQQIVDIRREVDTCIEHVLGEKNG